MSAPLHPDLEKDLARIVELLRQSTLTETDVSAAEAVTQRILPVLNGLNFKANNGIVAVALFSILLSMADEMEKEELAARSTKAGVN